MNWLAFTAIAWGLAIANGVLWVALGLPFTWQAIVCQASMFVSVATIVVLDRKVRW